MTTALADRTKKTLVLYDVTQGRRSVPAVANPEERIVFVSFSVSDIKEEARETLAFENSVGLFHDGNAAYILSCSDEAIRAALLLARDGDAEFWTGGRINMAVFASLVRQVRSDELRTRA